MNAFHVCLRCSRQLLRWKCQRRSSGFVSLGQLVGRDDDNRTTPQEVPVDNGGPTQTGLPRRKKRLTFAQKYQEQRKPKGVDKVLETLFASNRENEQALKRSRYSRQPIRTSAIERSAVEESIENRLRELHTKLLRGTAPLQEIWRDCESLLDERKSMRKDAVVHSGDKTGFEYSSTSVDTPANFHTLRDILVAICQRQRLVINGRDFTPVDAIKVYIKLGTMRYWWQYVLWCQLGHVLRLKYQSTGGTLGAAPNERICILLGEILEVWSLFMKKYRLQTSSISVPPSMGCDEVDDKTLTSKPFSSSFPKQVQTDSPGDTTVAAAMTLECLKAAEMRVPIQIMSLFNRFGQALARDRSIATRCLLLAGVSSEITEKALEGWEYRSSSEPEEISEPAANSTKSHLSKHPMGASQTRQGMDWSKHGLRTQLEMIDGASRRSDRGLAVGLWRQFLAHLETDKSDDETDSINRLYSQFLRTFWALRRYDCAIEVWNHMISSGHPPNQKHWNAMLTGCIRAKDVDSLQRVWTNMLRLGMRPETSTWTTYIHGLIGCHEWEKGFNALEQLGRIWNSAPPLISSETAAGKTTGTITADESQSTEKREDETILRPALSPINAALSALIHINKPSLLPRVLAWAQSHQVPLSTFTFNILLRPLVRHSSQSSIQAHLKQMCDANCTPDVGTFSIILNGLVSNPMSTFHTLPPEVQESTITSILADMERQGIKPNPFTYGTLLDGLLTPGSKRLSHDYTPNVPAARTILAHMASRKIYPSPHIYTILIIYYFTRRPLPDLPAISSLWSSIRHSGQLYHLNHVFFDRLVEGYADNDEIEESLKFLSMVPEQGGSPGWGALTRVLRALVRAREWERCGELVEDVEREGGLLRNGPGTGQKKYKGEFLALAELLRERGLVRPVDEER